MRLACINLGCKVNRVELDHFIFQFKAQGYEIVEAKDAECIVVNTCAVTTEAEKKTRKAIRRAAQMEHEPQVVVCGCSVSLHPEEIEALHKRVHACTDKFGLLDYVNELMGCEGHGSQPGAGIVQVAEPAGEDASLTEAALSAELSIEGLSRRRLGIKIQDGCDNRCTYCIIWKARGPARSLAVDEVLQQATRAVAAGVKELILTGINLGTYQAEYEGAELDLPDLIDILLERVPIERIRLSSLEPLDASDKLLHCMRRHGERVCRHLHLALQSGCDTTLQEMNRIYSSHEFAERIARARKILPDMSFSTDLIVAFPGETEEHFRQSYEFCRQMGFSKIHTFRYSARPGTPAAQRADQVPAEVSARRSEEIRRLQDELRKQDAQARIGTEELVLIEKDRQGTSGSYHSVQVVGLQGSSLVAGDLVRVRFTGLTESSELIGSFLTKIEGIETMHTKL